MITFKTNIQQKERPIDRQKTILIVDDEQNIRESLMKVLSRENYAVLPAASAKDAISLLGKHAVDLVISDIMMPEMDGLSLLKRIKQSFGDVEVLLITGHATVEMAVEAMREGAHDFIAKPFKRADILVRVQRVLEKQGLVRENRQLKTQLKCGVEKIQLIGESRISLIRSQKAMPRLKTLSDIFGLAWSSGYWTMFSPLDARYFIESGTSPMPTP